jgi:nitrite reductase/ring-hydroxylating ferredoxin subunit
MSDRIAIGPVDAIPNDRAVAVAGDRAVVLRIDGDDDSSGVRAFRNRCLHQDAPLADGWVRRGVLSCPLHFWRYDATTGRLRGGTACLDRFEVEVVDGQAFVLVPDDPPELSLREQLLARAAGYDRETEYRRAMQADDVTGSE